MRSSFNDEGINTIAGMAWPDPIDLTIRTNFDFNYVIDCMNQALLWVYFEDKVHTLYPFSLRGAQEVCFLLDRLNDPNTKPDAEKTLESAAAVVNMDQRAFLLTLKQVEADPYAKFIRDVWH